MTGLEAMVCANIILMQIVVERKIGNFFVISWLGAFLDGQSVLCHTHWVGVHSNKNSCDSRDSWCLLSSRAVIENHDTDVLTISSMSMLMIEKMANRMFRNEIKHGIKVRGFLTEITLHRNEQFKHGRGGLVQVPVLTVVQTLLGQMS